MKSTKRPAPKTAGDWIEVALDVISRDGVEAAAIEPLARLLKVSKGSFYWHFANRQALLDAALARWQKSETDDVIEAASGEEDPIKRIERLFIEVVSNRRTAPLYLAFSSSSDPAVKKVMRTVSRERLRFLRECYENLGLSKIEADHWALLAYTAYLGALHLRRDAPAEVPKGAAFPRYVQHLLTTLIPRATFRVSPSRERV